MDKEITLPIVYEPDQLPDIIKRLYKPAHSAPEADELLSHIELFESVEPICTTSKEWLYDKMVEQGFKTINVEGIMYWLVCFIN